MKSKFEKGDRVRVTDQVKRREATGHVVGHQVVEHFNYATKRSSRRSWVEVQLEEGGRPRLYTPAQVKKARRRKNEQ